MKTNSFKKGKFPRLSAEGRSFWEAMTNDLICTILPPSQVSFSLHLEPIEMIALYSTQVLPNLGKAT